MSPSPLAVGFDLDYTLWDQDPFAWSFFEAIAGELGGRLGCGRDAVAQAFHGAHARLTLAYPELFDEALWELGVRDPALVAELVGRYHRHRPPARAYPGAEELLGRLTGAGYALFLVTDGHSATQRHKVQALGLEAHFQKLVFTGDFQPELRKPSCFPFLYACARLGVAPSRCLFVGDNPLCDFQGPRKLGMQTVGVATGPFADLTVPEDWAPQLRIGKLRDLEGLL